MSLSNHFYRELRELLVRKCVSREDLEVSTEKFKELVRSLLRAGLAVDKGEVVCVEDPARSLLQLVLFGKFKLDLEPLVELVSWREFEDLVCDLLRSYNHIVVKRVRLPVKMQQGVERVEFDIVSIDKAHVIDNCYNILLIEVKHYRHSKLNVSEVCLRHLAKIKLVVNNKSSLYELMRRLPLALSKTFRLRIVPVIITLREYVPSIIEGVPIVPVWKLRDFLENYYLNLDIITSFVIEF